MNVDAFLDELRAAPDYADQIVHVHEQAARPACFAPGEDVPAAARALSARIGIARLYTHQAEALQALDAGRDVLIATSTSSGKSLCYTLPVLATLQRDPGAKALLLFPTKALCQDQFKRFSEYQAQCGLDAHMAGVFDGDTPSDLRRRLRDRASCIFSNPDMLHAALMAQHGRWAEFLSELRYLVIDEMHVYSGIFGTNMALLLRRFLRVCKHYGARPQIIACSATVANPEELAADVTSRELQVVDQDGSPGGRRVYVLWNPPRIRRGDWHSRRSANVEAHELMAALIERGVPTITFSKAKLTAEMIYRYVCDRLRERAPQRVSRVTPYRGGYLPHERREIERRLFDGELLGVSTTAALELGIDVGGLDACIMVGYPGTLASFFQQSGRAGRQGRDALIMLVGLDTSVNQYIMTHPDYLFDRPIEEGVIDLANPYVGTGHLRCATQELPLPDREAETFGEHATMILNVLNDNMKVRKIDEVWYHAAREVPQHEISLRDTSTGIVVIERSDSGDVIGQVDRFDAPPLLHPQAIYLHRGDAFRVRTLDLEKNIATVDPVDVDYYTQPFGGTDVHHIDQRLREKPLGTGTVCWGEVTAYFDTRAYCKIHFYTLDIISVHGLDLPTMSLDTMAFWIVPPDTLMEAVRKADLDPYSGLRGVGYATRMLLPLYLTCDTLDFSHTVGSANSPWQATFVYERYPLGLGFTEKAYARMHEILPDVLRVIRACPCEDGCPCCVGKPLRQYSVINVELWEASIPNKAAAIMLLEGLLGGGTALEQPDTTSAGASGSEAETRREQSLRRRLERMREPRVFHPITPASELETGYPVIEKRAELPAADAGVRRTRQRAFDRDMHKRISKKLDLGGMAADTGRSAAPKSLRKGSGNLKPTAFPGAPEPAAKGPDHTEAPLPMGDGLAARARKRYKQKCRAETDTDRGANPEDRPV